MATVCKGEKFRFAIDRGGTFTDVYAECPEGKVRVMKLLSVDPAYPDAPREGIRRILGAVNATIYSIFRNTVFCLIKKINSSPCPHIVEHRRCFPVAIIHLPNKPN